MSIPIKQLRPSSQVPQTNTSNPILIASPNNNDNKKKVKKEKNLAQSAPNPFRPPPPKAPIQRPRVPSCDPPSLDLPPSPLDPPLLLNGLAIKAKPKQEKEKKNISAMSRSLTNNVSFISSSAPPVSYVQFATANPFAPPAEKPIVEKPKSPKNVTIKETEKKRRRKDSENGEATRRTSGDCWISHRLQYA